MDDNSRKIIYKNTIANLTEQEVKVLLYLKKFNDPVKVEDLQKIYPEASKYSSENQEFKNKVNENLSKLNNGDEKLLSDWKITSELTIQNIKKIWLTWLT